MEPTEQQQALETILELMAQSINDLEQRVNDLQADLEELQEDMKEPRRILTLS